MNENNPFAGIVKLGFWLALATVVIAALAWALA